MKDIGVIVFIKNFELGTVKTRLAKGLGDEEALSIYKQLVDITLTELAKTGLPTHVFFNQYVDQDIVSQYGRSNFVYHIQEGEDLGQKMDHAFQKVLPLHDGVLIMGTDCPYFKSDNILNACKLLSSNAAVVGPANDGGYYSLGLSQYIDVFSNIEWSSSSVYQDTISRLEALQLSYDTLPAYDDIDYEADWIKYINSRTDMNF
ncbi:TIGR04282 family arsenosugar biosynthesis glycosyltransferase [Membranihabitans marinus]|uniref:TIGR04282 family arsenosugar biosynthesis glycosyltransferase n=1 Tax=Membranihabitans marinus TaxID=1227546 RepID=UPI001F016C4A|nr:TIGR04282 family arsenosugar biosynthesis glycosyltransferase [Membranihabitans marinus]